MFSLLTPLKVDYLHYWKWKFHTAMPLSIDVVRAYTTWVLIGPDIYNLLQWGTASGASAFASLPLSSFFLNSTYVNLISYPFSCSKLHSYGPRRTSAQWRQNHPSSSTGKMANAKIKVAYKRRRKNFFSSNRGEHAQENLNGDCICKNFSSTDHQFMWVDGTTFIISTIFLVASPPSLSSTNVALSKNASGNWNTMKVGGA